MDEVGPGQVHCNCRSCNQSFKVNQMRVVPVWYEEWKTFLTNHFCPDCYSEAVGALLKDSPDPFKWEKLVKYCDDHGIHIDEDPLKEFRAWFEEECRDIKEMSEDQQKMAWKILRAVFGERVEDDER